MQTLKKLIRILKDLSPKRLAFYSRNSDPFGNFLDGIKYFSKKYMAEFSNGFSANTRNKIVETIMSSLFGID